MDRARFLIAKYVPDVFRNEPRNIGVILWSPDGIVARFAGEKADTSGEMDDTQIPSFIASPVAYKEWIRYWRRELAKETIRPATGGASVKRTSPAFLDALSQSGPSNYYLADGGQVVEVLSAKELPDALDFLFEEFVAVPDLERSAESLKTTSLSAVASRFENRGPG